MAISASAAVGISDPGPNSVVTITGLGVGTSVVNVWRTVDDDRAPVRGARRITMNDAALVIDWDAPINRPVTYEVEVLSGPVGPSRTVAAPLTIISDTGWLMDPLVPQSAVPVMGKPKGDTGIHLQAAALASLEYAADVSMYNVMGSGKPLALFGQRMAAKGVDLSMATRSAEQGKRLLDLFKSSSGFLFRPGPDLDPAQLDAVMFLAAPTVKQLPVDPAWGGEVTLWDFQAETVAAPTVKVLTVTFTYGDVQLLVASYQQKQDAMAGKTYLDDLKNPLG